MPTSFVARPTAVDLFCGVGGLSLGLFQAGFRLLGAVDTDRKALDTHAANFPNVPTSPCDLFTTSGTQLRETLRLGDAAIDLLAGGPPCQGFSSGGVRAKGDPRNHGIMAFARLVIELRPRYFLMENVRGFLFKDHSDLRREFRHEVVSGGYTVGQFKLLNAADFGVPQRRLRAFVYGCLESEPLPDYPPPLASPPPTVRDALADLMVVDERPKGLRDDVYVGRLPRGSSYAAPLREVSRGGLRATLTGCRRTTHSDAVVGRFHATAPGEQEPISRFYRLAWDGISPTLRAGTGPEHGSHTAPRPIHPELARCITAREAARLHSFPDWFVFHGTRWHAFRQIGNSVPPMLAYAVGSALYNSIIRQSNGERSWPSHMEGSLDA